jgi:Gram-negative bacterial TonB protein C-terminal
MYRCTFPGCPVPVSVHISLIETLQRIVHTESGDRQGLIYGQASGAGAVVESSQALPGFGMEEMCRAIAEAHDPVVGYYRIREGDSLELTPDEVSLAVKLFARAGSVILLIERRAGAPEANFFFLEHGAYLNLPLLEFPLDVARLTEREAQRVRRVDEEALSVASVPGLPPAGSAASSPSHSANEKSALPWRPPTLLWMLAAIILVGVASYSAAMFLNRPNGRLSGAGAAKSAPPAARTSLRAERQGEDLKILWDLNSPEVAGATSGVLDIDDGGARRQIPMSADQVRFGSLLYTPVSDQVSVRLTTLKDNQSTKQESVLVLLKRPQQQAGSKGQINHIPFEVKTERVAPNRAFVPPDGNRETKSAVKLEDPPALQANPQRVELPASLRMGSMSPPPAIAGPRTDPAKTAIQTSPQRVDSLVPSPAGSVSPPAIVPPRSEPVKPALQANSQRVDLPAPSSPGAVSPSSGIRSEPAKPAVQTSSQRVDSAVQPPLAASPPPASGVPQSEPARPVEDAYVAPVLITQEGVHTPRELLPILTKPVAVSVRVDVNEAGRVTRAEAIPEKGIHALLLRAATDAARLCHFQPARQGQRPVSSTVTIVFHIGPEK